MKASIIIPTYNRADVIIRSLETWTKQTISVEEYEVIVVDNNSTDSTAKLVNDFVAQFPNLKYVKELKSGSTAARHAGAKIAVSDILIFADDDGLFNSECITEILKVYQSNSEIAAVAGKIDLLWDKTPPEWIEPYEFMLGKLNYGNEVVVGNDLYINGGLFSIKKSVFDELKGFNPDLVGNYLVGDGDTGLVNKLHSEMKLIGWTPFATMQHLLFVDHQGTPTDMGRRFYNIGISTSYALYKANNYRFKITVLKFISKSCLLWINKVLKNILDGKMKQKAYFSIMQRKGELVFFTQLRHTKIRKFYTH
jgi:glucosyl-dolichyl phosphate glucuronosyltransferase